MPSKRTLLIRPRDQRAGRLDWWITGAGQGGRDTDAETVIAEAGRGPATLVIPGEWLHLMRAEFPSRSRQKVRQAVPFVLEERLAEDVERLHFALGPHLGDGEFPVGVIARDLLRRCLEALEEAGITIERAVAEPHLLPRHADGPSVWLEQGRAVVREDDWKGFACEIELLPTLLGGSRPADEHPAARPVHVYAPAGVGKQAIEWPAGVEPIEHAGEVDPIGPADEPRAPLDLLQGEFERQDRAKALIRAWRPAAILAVVAVLVQTGPMAWEARQLEARLQHTEDQIAEVFHDALPDTRRMVNPRVQLQQALDQLEQPEASRVGMLELLGKAAPILSASRENELQGIEYSDQTLTLRVATRRYADVETLRSRLADAGGMDVELVGANTREGRTEASIRITGTGGSQ